MTIDDPRPEALIREALIRAAGDDGGIAYQTSSAYHAWVDTTALVLAELSRGMAMGGRMAQAVMAREAEKLARTPASTLIPWAEVVGSVPLGDLDGLGPILDDPHA